VILPRLRAVNFISLYTYKIATIFILSIRKRNSRDSNLKSKNAKGFMATDEILLELVVIETKPYRRGVAKRKHKIF